jgi:hypothetical protein
MLINKKLFLLFIISFSILSNEKSFSSSIKANKREKFIIYNHKEIASKFVRGESFKQGEATYTLYPELKATFNDDNNSKTLSKDHSASKVIVTESFIIYNFPKFEQRPRYQNQVVFNENTETFGILSGAVIVKMKNNLEFNDSSFEVIKKYPELGYYILALPTKNKIEESIKKVKFNKNVDEFIIEVLENFQETL